MHSFIVKYLITICFIFSTIFLSAQNIEKNLPTNSMIEIGTDYSSNNNTMGQITRSVKQPSTALFCSYYGKKGLNLSAMYSLLKNGDTSFTKTSTLLSLQAGYAINFLKKFSFTPSLAYLHSSGNSASALSSYKFGILADLFYTTNNFTAGVSSSYLIGNEYNDLIISTSVKYLFEQEGFFCKKDYIAIQPSVELTFAKQSFMNNDIHQQFDFLRKWDFAPDTKVRDIFNGEMTEEELRKIRQEIDQNSEFADRLTQLEPNIPIENLFTSEEKFTLSALTISVPVYYIIGNFTFNISTTAYKPISKVHFFKDKFYLLGSAGISYTFQLKK